MTKLKELEKAGRKAWLATIGTYAKGWEVISGKVNATFEETNQRVNELIENGEKIETDLKARVKSNTLLDDKIAALKIKLGVETRAEDKLAELSKKLDILTEEVGKLVIARTQQQTKSKPAAKKVAVKRTAEKKDEAIKAQAKPKDDSKLAPTSDTKKPKAAAKTKPAAKAASGNTTRTRKVAAKSQATAAK